MTWLKEIGAGDVGQRLNFVEDEIGAAHLPEAAQAGCGGTCGKQKGPAPPVPVAPSWPNEDLWQKGQKAKQQLDVKAAVKQSQVAAFVDEMRSQEQALAEKSSQIVAPTAKLIVWPEIDQLPPPAGDAVIDSGASQWGKHKKWLKEEKEEYETKSAGVERPGPGYAPLPDEYAETLLGLAGGALKTLLVGGYYPIEYLKLTANWQYQWDSGIQDVVSSYFECFGAFLFNDFDSVTPCFGPLAQVVPPGKYSPQAKSSYAAGESDLVIYTQPALLFSRIGGNQFSFNSQDLGAFPITKNGISCPSGPYPPSYMGPVTLVQPTEEQIELCQLYDNLCSMALDKAWKSQDDPPAIRQWVKDHSYCNVYHGAVSRDDYCAQHPEWQPECDCGVCPEQHLCEWDQDKYACICQPACDGKECGDDGCGGTCGECLNGDLCIDGKCVCQPQCDGKECGPDGCYGTCGTCGEGFKCEEGVCVECQPQCAGKECGSDGCGGTCGTCACGEDCLGGDCYDQKCKGQECGADGCGGSCGTCEDELTCVAGQCTCVPDCAGKVCGGDGCDSTCGTCPDGCQCSQDASTCETPPFDGANWPECPGVPAEYVCCGAPEPVEISCMEQAADSALELLDYMLRNFSTNLEWIFGVKSIIYQAPDDPPDTLYVSIETGLLEKDLGPLCGQDYPFSKCEQGFEVPLTVLETWDPETGYATGDSAHSLHLERSATPCANTFSELISTIAPEDDNLGAGCDSYEFETLTEWHGAVQANSDKPANWIRIRLADLPPPCLPF